MKGKKELSGYLIEFYFGMKNIFKQVFFQPLYKLIIFPVLNTDTLVAISYRLKTMSIYA